MLTVLRNRAYVGEIVFRGKHHRARHAPLVDGETFARAQRVLVERGEDHARRSSMHSTYLLSGLVVCAQRGKRFVGSAATGRSARYPYYTCFSRQPYGVTALDADIRKTEQAIDRYLTAFEAGTMPEAECGPRIKSLADKLGAPQRRHTEVADAISSPAKNDRRRGKSTRYAGDSTLS